MDTKGYVDLERVLQEFTAWEQKTVDLMHDNAELQLKVKTLEKQCQEYKRAQTEAQNVSSEYLTTVERLQDALARRCNLEEENELLKKQLGESQETLQQMEDGHHRQIKEAMSDLEAAREAHRKEVAMVQEAAQQQSRQEVEVLQRLLQDKTNEVKQLQKKVSDVEREKHTELVKLRLEHDSKVLQLQKQNAYVQSGMYSSGPGSSTNSDIFRKKLQHMKQESTREASALKQTIAELERKLAMANRGRRKL